MIVLSEINLTCVLARENVLAGTDGPQMGYVLIEALPIGEGINERMPLNLSLVLDRSGSMAGQKIQHLQESVKLLVDTLARDDVLSVILFDDKADLLVPAQLVNEKESINNLLAKITDRGGTEISRGIKLSIEELRKNLNQERITRMIVLTDGQTYGDEKASIKLVKKLHEDDIGLSVFGLGEDWNEDFLDELAEGNGPNGRSDFIENPNEILPRFQEVVTGMARTVTTNNLITLRLVQGVSPRQVWRVLPMIANLGYEPLSDRDVQVPLGDLQSGTGQSILVEFTIPSRSPGRFRLAQTEITYDVPSEGLVGQKFRADCVVNYIKDDVEANKVNPKVMNHVEKATAFKLQTRALDAAKTGDVGRATQLLRQSATRLLSMGENALATVALEEASQLESDGKMSPTGTKKLRYDTQRLNKLPED